MMLGGGGKRNKKKKYEALDLNEHETVDLSKAFNDNSNQRKQEKDNVFAYMDKKPKVDDGFPDMDQVNAQIADMEKYDALTQAEAVVIDDAPQNGGASR